MFFMLGKKSRIVASFYKYVNVENAPEFVTGQLELCKSLNLKGRILIGYEGINGSVYGNKENIDEYKKKLWSIPMFSDLEFREQISDEPAFRKLFVRLMGEIVNFGFDVNLKNTGRFIAPSELKDILDKNEDVVLVDVRNGYEAKIGKFRNARTLSMRNFRDFPKFLPEIGDLKDKRIVTYCTGGIRCEKASALLLQNGFKNVSQLKGGILKFGEEFPDTYWEGKCFVFDDRIAISINRNDNTPINECAWCGNKSDEYLNCHNIRCDKLFICCRDCGKKYNGSCSEECYKAPRRRKESQLSL